MSQIIKESELGAFTAEFFNLSPEQQEEALKNFMLERNAMAEDLEKKTQILAANQGTINNLPVVTFKGEKYQFTRAKFSRKKEQSSVELTAEDMSKDEDFIAKAIETKSALLRKI